MPSPCRGGRRSGGGGGEWNAATGAATAASRRHARRCSCRGSLAWCPVSLPDPSPVLVVRACRRRRRPRNQVTSDWGRCSGTRQRTTTVPRRHVYHRCRRPLPLLLLLPLPLQLLPTPPSRVAPPGVFCLSQPPSGAGWHTPATLWMACRGKRRPRVSWQCPTGKPALASSRRHRGRPHRRRHSRRSCSRRLESAPAPRSPVTVANHRSLAPARADLVTGRLVAGWRASRVRFVAGEPAPPVPLGTTAAVATTVIDAPAAAAAAAAAVAVDIASAGALVPLGTPPPTCSSFVTANDESRRAPTPRPTSGDSRCNRHGSRRRAATGCRCCRCRGRHRHRRLRRLLLQPALALPPT